MRPWQPAKPQCGHKALGLTVLPSILLRADELIE
jgi:hypothetical protein